MNSFFNKKVNFKCESLNLPASNVFFSSKTQKHESLQIIKSILNHVKSKLNDYQIEEWSRHTRNRNPAQQIITHIKNEMHAEFVTQAFAKFFEILNAYPIANASEKSEFLSVHLCEAPGAFVCALNHYLALHHSDTTHKWRATTLNPYFEGNSIGNSILDDRFILHTLDNWFFGEDYTGDILQEFNIRSLINYCKSFGNVSLVTGDGSIDCLENPENQEELVSKLKIAELIVCLSILSEGGSMVIKMFTFFESCSISMLYIINCCFNSVNIFKPATSKEGNSEVYVIGIGYKKGVISEEIIEKMLKNFKDDSKSILPLEAIPEKFMDQVVQVARYYMNQQVSVIEANIRTFKKYDKHENEVIRQMKISMNDQYYQLYKCAPIKENQKILHGLKINNHINLNVRVHSGSHNDRKVFLHLSRRDQYQVFMDRLKQFYDSIFENALNSSCVPLRLSDHELKSTDFINLIHGRSVKKVASSKFILVSLLKYMIELQTFLESSPVIEKYTGRKFNILENHFTIDIDFYRRATSYDEYERCITDQLLSFLLNASPEQDSFIIEGLPLFTQFTVGVILYLSLFVFEEVHLNPRSGCIKFKSLLPNGKIHLEKLIEMLKNATGVVGICNTKTLFTYSPKLYESVIDYNNHACLKFCSFYLNQKNITF